MGIAGKTFCFLLAGVMVLLWNTSALAKVLYVSPDGSDLNDGTSWMRAKRSITAALAVARAGDQIWARYGVYHELITLKDGVSLYGGFRGTERTLAERPAFPRSSPDPYETVLDGDQGGSVVRTPSVAYQRYRLDGFTVRNGNSIHGGGLYCVGLAARRLVVANCTISGNRSNSTGGGVYCEFSSPTLTSCTISGNTASLYSGGVCCYDSSPTLTNCTISGNRADYYGGGGVYCYGRSSPTVTNCTISGNTANDSGGGVYCYEGSSPTLTKCTISQNTASYGGGVYCYGRSSPTLTSCLVLMNDALSDGGGMIYAGTSQPTLIGCLLVGNRARRYGGGMYCQSSSMPSLTNCTFAYNIGYRDGGAIASEGGGSVVNTLIAFNTSGIYYSAWAPVIFHHNCVWGNDAYNYRGIPDPTGTDGNISTDPLMIACHLLPGSPCIDAGDDSVIDSDSTDFDGEARIGGNRVDIGADEFHPPIVQGWMTFSDYVGTPLLFVPFELRAGSTEVQQILVDPDGGFVVPGVPFGEFALSVKPLSYLRRTVDVDTSAGSVLGLQLELVNGDIDGDNEVTLFDFGRLVAAFGSAPGDANWDENADLDGDEEITLFDFGILVRNFGEVGDD
jgi:parallel beta-helix repeat protein